MKIREIVESTPMGSIGTAVGKAVGGVAKGLGAVAGGAVAAAGQARSGYKAGQDKMAKLLNPSRWFEKTPSAGKKSTPTVPSGIKKTKSVSATQIVDNPKALAQIFDQVIAGNKPLDQSVLQQLHSKYRPQIDNADVVDIIDRLFRGGQLNSQHLSVLKKYRRTL